MRIMSAVFSVVLAGACTGEVYPVATVTATPDLVYAAPGVQVIADYDEPIFFADGLYWWSVDGLWYRSTYYTGGWVVGTPPIGIVRIGPPIGYRHYRPNGFVGHHRPVPSHRIQRPVVRDHRARR